MAANTNSSDLDRADASITKLAAHLHDFTQACESRKFEPSIREGLQQLRLSHINKDLDEILKDLNSARSRLDSSTVSREQDTADQKEKQATLDKKIQAAEERERRLSDVIRFAEGQVADTRQEKAEAKAEKAKTKEKKAAVEARDKTIAAREKAVEVREKAVEAKEKAVEAREQDLEKRFSTLEARKKDLRANVSNIIDDLSAEDVEDVRSTAKRPLSSRVEPTSKRTKSIELLVHRVNQDNMDPIGTNSSDRVFQSPRFQRSTNAALGPSESTTGPSGSATGTSGSTAGPSLSTGPAEKYGLRPGFLVCPVDIRLTDDETQRTWAQISFSHDWTMEDSITLLTEFNKLVAKRLPHQTPHYCLDRCADVPLGVERCLLRVMRKAKSNWKKSEDATLVQCQECSQKVLFCLRITYVDPHPGEYDKDATNGNRWTITRRQS